MPISEDEVRHVAALARLALDDAEIATLAPQLGAILAYAAEVGRVATADVEPLTHPLGLVDVSRPDVAGPRLTREALLAAAPDARDGRFAVPRIVEEDA
jgi:aspartyl-tRNA(Asn)/glutamyl-tRNA(Gln) amidotransferase subunit C